MLILQKKTGIPIPGAPANLTATAGDEEVVVAWDAVSGADSYTVHYKAGSSGVTTGDPTVPDTITGTTVTHTGLTNGTEYFYAATATNVSGTGPLSNEDSDTPTAPVLPGWSLGSSSYDSVSWSPSTGGFFETSATFSQTGHRIYVTDVDGSVYQYTTTNFSLSSPVAAGASANLYDPGGGFGGGDMLPDCVEFKTDGTRMFVGSNWDGNGAAYIHEYTLNTAWDVTSTLTYVGSYQVPGAFEGNFGFHFKPDGTKLFIATTATGPASSNPRILEIVLGTTWSIAGSNTLNDTQVVSSVDPFSCNDVYVDPTGTKLFWTGASTNKMHEESLGTAWDLTSFSFTPANEQDTSSQTTPAAMVWKHDDGTKAYVFGGGTLYQYDTP